MSEGLNEDDSDTGGYNFSVVDIALDGILTCETAELQFFQSNEVRSLLGRSHCEHVECRRISVDVNTGKKRVQYRCFLVAQDNTPSSIFKKLQGLRCARRRCTSKNRIDDGCIIGKGDDRCKNVRC